MVQDPPPSSTRDRLRKPAAASPWWRSGRTSRAGSDRRGMRMSLRSDREAHTLGTQGHASWRWVSARSRLVGDSHRSFDELIRGRQAGTGSSRRTRSCAISCAERDRQGRGGRTRQAIRSHAVRSCEPAWLVHSVSCQGGLGREPRRRQPSRTGIRRQLSQARAEFVEARCFDVQFG